MVKFGKMVRQRESAAQGSAMRFFLRTVLPGALFIVAGMLHFVFPGTYRAIVPPGFGERAVVVAFSGAAEIAGGIGLCVPATRTAAGFGLIALLIAVWPANWWMALESNRFAFLAPSWVLWVRVAVQIPLIWWISAASRKA